MRRHLPLLLLVPLLLLLGIGIGTAGQEQPEAFLPIVLKPLPTPTPLPPETEFRGLWVTRFDWPMYGSQTDIDEIVDNVAYAGFNVILFQVRGTADAFYDSNVEPWSHRLTGTLGQDPGWDPLAHMILKAHEKGIQVHAYINVYPVGTGCIPPVDGTSPRHLYYLVRDHHGTTGTKPNGLQWSDTGAVICSPYYRTSPASAFVDSHLMNMASDLVENYDVDGIHLDHIRYAGKKSSFDPASSANYDNSYTYEAWQRRQVNGTVLKFYNQIVPLKPGLWLSAAVWPIYVDYWGWHALEGYHDYYQDSKDWLAGGYNGGTGYIDSISPMIYPASFNCPDDSFWSQSKWQTLVTDFQASRSGRYVIPGIGTGYCTFDEIEQRISFARSIGTAGHALFSYSGLLAHGYFDELANGPYALPAIVPSIPWHS
jgi:uncharacterized lipoprotein YddW (UPF0748 family)